VASHAFPFFPFALDLRLSATSWACAAAQATTAMPVAASVASNQRRQIESMSRSCCRAGMMAGKMR